MSADNANETNVATMQQHQQSDDVDNLSSSTEKQQVYGGAPSTPADTAVEISNVTSLKKKQHFGHPTLVESFGSFPGAGSRLGPFFCLGRLGRGTFCSIHRCIDLRYFHSSQQETKRHRLVAAKVELSSFANSGVLEGEATMLGHLHDTLPPKSVPAYMGHFRSDEASAIVMQYLPGEDMHQLRHRQQRRRLRVEDAVYLTADVMLPLLQKMHRVGVVHRDVKPSNCVRMGTEASNKDFCMVDFGLSKSIVVPKDSTYADPEHAWPGEVWSVPPNVSPDTQGCLRKERPTAEFRGTSMYASLRVHQLHDYSRRDDMWSLLYVFCDLVSGGLPWMSYAATRERDACQKLKERIHGDKDGSKDETEQMLMGEKYYVSAYNREVARKKGKEESDLPELAKPLAMSKDASKVELLRVAFAHVAQLKFSDEPDYGLIQKCIKGFLNDTTSLESETVKPLDWTYVPPAYISSSKKQKSLESRKLIPCWDLLGDPDPLDVSVLEEADAERRSQSDIGEQRKSLESGEKDMARLPLTLQFRVAQMEYNTRHSKEIAPHLALRDWLQCVLELLYGHWDSLRYEKGNHRTDTDGYRREVYLKLLEKCLRGAKAFNNFRDRSCFYEDVVKENGGAAAQDPPRPRRKRRKISVSQETDTGKAAFVTLSKAMFGLRMAIDEERRKKFAPPPALSFGSGVGGSALE